jgi:carbonic anhydrase
MRRAPVLAILFFVCAPVVSQPVDADKLWEALMVGNRHYAAGTITYDHLKEMREELRDHQNPPVTVLSCADSRVPPELIFNQSLGTLFVVRVAGNTPDTFGLASVEYAIANGYTSLIVVLGHENCGAVKAALAPDDPGTPSLLALVQRIRASFPATRVDEKDAAALKRAIEANARAAAALLPAQSKVIRDAVLSGRVKIIAAYYDFDDGIVQKVE